MKQIRTASALFLLVLASCAAPLSQPTLTPPQPAPMPIPQAGPAGTLTTEQVATLNSLELVDEHPLYTMRYAGMYDDRLSLDSIAPPASALGQPAPAGCGPTWGCSLFATLGDENNRLFGRNFDWQFSPALLLFTSPPDGYASVSMVDLEYLGFAGDRSRNIQDLSLAERRSLLKAPFLPFDGMNEKGLAIGMAAVPAEKMPYDPTRKTLDHLEVIREILDHAATVAEAVDVLGRYNIDMGNVPLHYLIASARGDSALVEFRAAEMVVLRNESPWQQATNFLVSSMAGHPKGQCQRYDRISLRLKELQGRLSSQDAYRLLNDVSQESTQWSLVYNMTGGDLGLVMDRRYSEDIHTFRLEPSLK
jgi:hypothetical protein